MSGHQFTLEVNPRIPAELERLNDLANDLWYSWNRSVRDLFNLINPVLWERCGHKPKVFLRSVDEATLERVVEDQVFLSQYQQVLAEYDTYIESPHCSVPEFHEDDLVAYFCAEYGIHESLPIYSGGLGILAGDHCKAASDMCIPFIGVGLLYGQGYFTQNIDGEGNQIALYHESCIDEMPVSPAVDGEGKQIRVIVSMPGRDVVVRVWTARVGHVRLYLLDTNIPQNSPEDREITHKLYGGGAGTRIRQEMILGIGGVRVLAKLGLRPTVWHINEGHSAFMVLERSRQLVKGGLDFAEALEMVSTRTVFTTHTPVPAGHDVFPGDLALKYFMAFIAEIGISDEEFLNLGRMHRDSTQFNMTTLAVRSSRHQNGVSRIHGYVSAGICADCWPQVPPTENPLSYVTNGVHVYSFLDHAWSELFDRFLGASWRNHLTDPEFWKRIDEIPDHLFWSVSQSIKSRMIDALRKALTQQFQRNQISEVHLERVLKHLDPGDPNVLTIGFARRFATYKRATLLLNNVEWLKEIVNHSDRPVVFVFAGKAHPADEPGKNTLRELHNMATRPEFVDKMIIVEGYDLALGRRLVAGVDVWLNNPIYPLEASGTSGMKAAMNGTLNLSIMDGWWYEGYDGQNGWAIKPSTHTEDEARRDYEEARSLYETLQDEVIPLYYDREGGRGYSHGWVRRCKHAMTTILPRFNTHRMLHEYCRNLYLPAAENSRRLVADNYREARSLAAWKRRVAAAWPGISLVLKDRSQERIDYGECVELSVSVQLNGLPPEDVIVELLLSHGNALELSMAAASMASGISISSEGMDEESEAAELMVAQRFQPAAQVGRDGACDYTLKFEPQWCGKLHWQVRAFPYLDHLTHAHETGLMVWLEQTDG